jgi:hypothetical protein
MICIAYIAAPAAAIPHTAAGATGRGVAEPRCGYKPAYPTWPQATSGAGEGGPPFDPPPVPQRRTGWSGDAALVIGIASFAIIAVFAPTVALFAKVVS